MKKRLLLFLPLLGLAAILLYVGLSRHPQDARGRVVIFQDRAGLRPALENAGNPASNQLQETLADFKHHTGRFLDWLHTQGLPYTYYDHIDFVVLVNGHSVSVPRATLRKARFGVLWIAPDGSYRLCAGTCGTDVDLIRKAGTFFGCRPTQGLPDC
ncbi:MAG TPA: hypothetical protein VKB51_03270 [bacterium]|nr:hypothetical protein [bacterium]